VSGDISFLRRPKKERNEERNLAWGVRRVPVFEREKSWIKGLTFFLGRSLGTWRSLQGFSGGFSLRLGGKVGSRKFVSADILSRFEGDRKAKAAKLKKRKMKEIREDSRQKGTKNNAEEVKIDSGRDEMRPRFGSGHFSELGAERG